MVRVYMCMRACACACVRLFMCLYSCKVCYDVGSAAGCVYALFYGAQSVLRYVCVCVCVCVCQCQCIRMLICKDRE